MADYVEQIVQKLNSLGGSEINIFIGGNRKVKRMAFLYKMLIKVGYVCFCPNLMYEGIDCQVTIERDLILKDCLNQLKHCDFAIFVLGENQETSEFVQWEIDFCKCSISEPVVLRYGCKFTAKK